MVDAFHGGFVPFHMLTKEYYELLKQRLSSKGAAVFNVHDWTKLYVSTIKTLKAVFSTVQLFPSGEGEVAIVVTDAPVRDEILTSRASAMDEKYKFRFPLISLLKRREPEPSLGSAELLTDDFAPVDLYKTLGRAIRRKK